MELYNIYWYDSYGNKSLIVTTNNVDKWLEENSKQRIANGELPESPNDFEIEEVEVVTGSKDVLGEKAISLPEAVNNHYKAQTRPSKVKDPKTKKERTVQASASVAEEWKFAIADDILTSKLVGSSIDALNTTQKTKNVYQQYGSAMICKINLTKDKKLIKIVNFSY